MTSLDKLKCSLCHTLPDSAEIIFCDNKHLACGKCFRQVYGICHCKLPLSKPVTNPLLVSLNTAKDVSPTTEKKPCPFHELGCTWVFSDDDLSDHLSECKYRIIPCIGTTLGIWTCPWKGQQLAIGDHFQENHGDVGDFFSYFQESHIPFNEFITSGTINLIDAFNKKFVFYFHSNAETKIVYFAIVLMGMKTDAENFSYEFTIRSDEQSRRKIKFVEDVYNTDFDIEMFLKAERCVTLSHRTLKNHLNDNNIHFRFVISKKDDTERMAKYSSQTSLDSAQKKQAALKVPNKTGKMAINRRSGGGSISTGGGGGGSGPALVSVPRNINTIQYGQMGGYSSINKLKLREGICRIPGVIDTPCLTPSINRSNTIEQMNANLGTLYIDPRMSAINPGVMTSSAIKTNTPQPGYKQQTNKQYSKDIRQNGNSKYKNK